MDKKIRSAMPALMTLLLFLFLLPRADARELIQSGGFEEGLSGWEAYGKTGYPTVSGSVGFGKYSLKIDSSVADVQVVYQPLTSMFDTVVLKAMFYPVCGWQVIELLGGHPFLGTEHEYVAIANLDIDGQRVSFSVGEIGKQVGAWHDFDLQPRKWYNLTMIMNGSSSTYTLLIDKIPVATYEAGCFPPGVIMIGDVGSVNANGLFHFDNVSVIEVIPTEVKLYLENQELKTQIDSLEKQIDNLTTAIHQHTMTLEELGNSLEETKEERDTAMLEKGNLQTQLDTLSNTLESLVLELESAELLLEARSNELAELYQEKESLSEKHSKEMSDKDSQLESATNKVANLTLERDRLSSDILGLARSRDLWWYTTVGLLILIWTVLAIGSLMLLRYRRRAQNTQKLEKTISELSDEIQRKENDISGLQDSRTKLKTLASEGEEALEIERRKLTEQATQLESQRKRIRQLSRVCWEPLSIGLLAGDLAERRKSILKFRITNRHLDSVRLKRIDSSLGSKDLNTLLSPGQADDIEMEVEVPRGVYGEQMLWASLTLSQGENEYRVAEAFKIDVAEDKEVVESAFDSFIRRG